MSASSLAPARTVLTETRTNLRLEEARESRAFVEAQIRTADAGDVAGWESELPAINAEIERLVDEIEREVEYDRLAYRYETGRSC